MSRLLILFIIFLPSAWGFFPPTESGTQALYESLPGKKEVITEHLKTQIQTVTPWGIENCEMKMTTVASGANVPPAEWVPVVDTETRMLTIELRITDEALKSPLVLGEEMLRMNQIQSLSFAHPYEWAETVANAKEGSARALEKLARMDYQVALNLQSWLESNPQFFEGEVDSAKIEQWSKARIAEAKKRYEPIAKAAKAEARRLQKEWDAKRATFNELEKQDKKFNDLVMANDRAGVRRMLEEYLPWVLMEPSEKRVWKDWLDAMENPDSSRRQLVFRGMDDYPVLKAANSEKVGVVSSVLAMNQGNYTRRLRSLATSREKTAQRMAYHKNNGDFGVEFLKDTPSIIEQMKSHAGNPVGSPFISVSDNQIASMFGNRERMALLVDERRLVPNALAFGYGEKERLIPLVIFPDEVVHYHGKADGALINEQFLAKVQEKLGRVITPEELNMTLDELEFRRRGFDRLHPQLLGTEGISLQGPGCAVGLPCDCITKGLSKLLNE